MTDEARERWKQKHRRRRKRAPKVALARNIAAVLALLATIAFILLGVFVGWGWGTGAFICGYLFLRLLGVRPFESGVGDGADAYVD